MRGFTPGGGPGGPRAAQRRLDGWATYNYVQDNDDLLTDYCSYGSTSLAQLKGCEGPVEPGAVRQLGTPGAEYAGGKPECGPGSGPFCSFSHA